MPSICHVITTTAFQPGAGEDTETNPGVYGRDFAEFIADRLRARGEPVEAVMPEDFGWCVLLSRKPTKKFICCGNREGRVDEWMAFAVVETGLVSRLFGGVNIDAETDRLSRMIAEIVREAPDVSAYSTEQ